MTRRLHLMALAVALAVTLGGCSTLQTIKTAWQAATEVKVSPTAVILAADAFNAIEASATVYLRQAKCTGPAKPTCRDPGVTRKIKPAILEGRKARDALIAFLEAHPGQLGDKGLYDALQASIGTAKSVMTTYGIGGVQ